MYSDNYTIRRLERQRMERAGGEGGGVNKVTHTDTERERKRERERIIQHVRNFGILKRMILPITLELPCWIAFCPHKKQPPVSLNFSTASVDLPKGRAVVRPHSDLGNLLHGRSGQFVMRLKGWIRSSTK